MLHFRITSWAAFRCLIKRREYFVRELQGYSVDLISGEVQRGIQAFREKYHLNPAHGSFEALNGQTGNLLIWVLLA